MGDESRRPPIDSMPSRENERTAFQLVINPTFEGFRAVEVLKYDETKPWRPPLEVRVTQANGSVIEVVNANTPAFTIQDQEGRTLHVSIETAGHIDDVHIHAKEPGSKFAQESLSELMHDVVAHLPADVMSRTGISTFDMEIGRHMGLEGIASMDELLREGTITEADVATAQLERARVFALNKSGAIEDKRAFIDAFRSAHPDNKIQFQFVRNTVIVPVVAIGKRPTTKLFMMIGPGADGKLSVYTVAPGREMPRHPNPNEHTDSQGKFNEETFQQSADAWFSTVTLTG